MARKKEFDEDAALDRALALFWVNGHECTSLPQLVDATGVQRQSLHDTFGDKQALYLAALRRYAATAAEGIAALSRPAKSPLKVLRAAFLEAAVHDGCAEARGCAISRSRMDPPWLDDAVRGAVGLLRGGGS